MSILIEKIFSLLKGGTHVGHVVDQVVSKLLESAKKKNKGGMDLKPFHIKGHIWIFINCLIENLTIIDRFKAAIGVWKKLDMGVCKQKKFNKSFVPGNVYDVILAMQVDDGNSKYKGVYRQARSEGS